MKVFIAICFLSIVAAQDLSNAEKSALQGYAKVCIEESKVNTEHIKTMRSGQEVEDAALNQYIYCMFKKLGFINKEDEVQYDTIKSKSPGHAKPEEVEQIINSCKKLTGKNIQETAYKMYACFLKSGGKVLNF